MRYVLPRLAVVAVLAGTSAPLLAQCPDGTPPPCAHPGAGRVATNSVAVLYFDNLSRDTSLSYLADGLTEEIIATLGKVRRLDVKSLYASQQFRGRPAGSPAALARALGAAYLVRGSVRPAQGRVRVTYELIRASSGAHVVGDVLDRSGADVASAPGDIAAAVAGAIIGTLQPGERSSLGHRPTENAEAYDLYLRAREAVQSWSQQGPAAATALLDRAITLDSGFAAAYAAKAVASSMLADGYELPSGAYKRVRGATDAALRLDSSLALAWAIRATATMALDYDLPEGVRQGQRAIELDPRLNWGYMVVGVSRLGQAQTAEAIDNLRRGWLLDTLDEVAAGMLEWAFYTQGQGDSMASYLERMNATLDPDSKQGYRGLVAFVRHDYPTTVSLLNWRYYGGWLAAPYVRAQLELGRRSAARATIDSMISARATGYFNPMAIAASFAVLGDADSAFAWLDRAYQERTAWLAWIKVYPELASLRSDPRFAALLARLHF